MSVTFVMLPDLSVLKNSLNREIWFRTLHTRNGKPVYEEIFKGVLGEVHEGYILVDYISVAVDDDFAVTTTSRKRKLLAGEFDVDNKLGF